MIDNNLRVPVLPKGCEDHPSTTKALEDTNSRTDSILKVSMRSLKRLRNENGSVVYQSGNNEEVESLTDSVARRFDALENFDDDDLELSISNPLAGHLSVAHLNMISNDLLPLKRLNQNGTRIKKHSNDLLPLKRLNQNGTRYTNDRLPAFRQIREHSPLKRLNKKSTRIKKHSNDLLPLKQLNQNGTRYTNDRLPAFRQIREHSPLKRLNKKSTRIKKHTKNHLPLKQLNQCLRITKCTMNRLPFKQLNLCPRITKNRKNRLPALRSS